MEKIPTLYTRNPQNMQLVTREVHPEAAWVLAGQGLPTVKRDGTNVRVTIAGERVTHVEKRRNPTREEKAAGAEPGYIDAHPDDSADKHIFAAVAGTDYRGWPDGVWSCEALGPKIQGGVESPSPVLYAFSLTPTPLEAGANPRTFDEIQQYLADHKIEGIVWHHPDGRMAKIKRKDLGLTWPIRDAK